MVAPILVVGIAGFAALLLPDLCRRQSRLRLALLCSVLGYAAVLIALVLQVASFRPAGPVILRAAAGIVSGLFAVLLVYSVLVEIPLHRRRTDRGAETRLYTEGTYRLSRHPGLLWFIVMQLSLNAVFRSGSFLAVSATLALSDLVLVFVQDTCIFPLVFPGYDEYKLRVPFLFPRLRPG